jgi:pimeloyl-ACP methyl ester carboxylesterase
MTRERLFVERWGSGPRRALLIHGLTSSGAGWWQLGEALAGSGYEATAPDLRGHGRSPRGDELSIGAYRDDILQLGRHWDLVVAHSLGGTIALAGIAAVPRLTDRLVLVDPAIDSIGTARFLAAAPEPTSPPTPDRVAAEHPRWDPRDVAYKVESLQQLPPDTRRRTMEDAAPWDYGSVLAGLQVPTLLLAADASVGALVTVERGEAVAADNPNVSFAVVAGAGHSIVRDDFAAMWQMIGAFVAAGSIGDELVDRGEVVP